MIDIEYVTRTLVEIFQMKNLESYTNSKVFCLKYFRKVKRTMVCSPVKSFEIADTFW